MVGNMALQAEERQQEGRELRFDRLFARLRKLLPGIELREAEWLHWRFWCEGTVAKACASFIEAVMLLAGTLEMSALCLLELSTALRAVVDELDLLDAMEGRVRRIGRRVIAEMREEAGVNWTVRLQVEEPVIPESDAIETRNEGRLCAVCSGPLLSNHPRHRTCSPACRQELKRERMEAWERARQREIPVEVTIPIICDDDEAATMEEEEPSLCRYCRTMTTEKGRQYCSFACLQEAHREGLVDTVWVNRQYEAMLEQVNGGRIPPWNGEPRIRSRAYCPVCGIRPVLPWRDTCIRCR